MFNIQMRLNYFLNRSYFLENLSEIKGEEISNQSAIFYNFNNRLLFIKR
jgi:hypothetical protein